MTGVENDGTRALYEALKRKLTILLGPMTNIATLIQNHPILFRKSRKFLFVRRTQDSFQSRAAN
jgi:inosine-uridine nucleoside N-ribohydrolase